MAKKKKQTPFVLLIVGILLIGIITSGIIWWSSAKDNKYIVNFYDHQNKMIAQYKVKDGESVFFDKSLPTVENSVFKGWNKNLSAITEDIEVYPIYQSIEKDNNVFYMDTYYVNGGEDLWIDLKIGGVIDAKAAIIGIAYDSEVLTYLENSSSEYLSSPIEVKDDYLIFSFDFSDKNIQNGSIVGLHFECKDVEFLTTDLPIDLLNVQSSEGLTSSTAVKGNIYIY